jgi:2-keto-4-pentenoate hydratase
MTSIIGPMKSDVSRAASDLLYGLWTAGRRIDQLPPELRPVTRADGYAIQALIQGHSTSSLFGWKIAATSAAGQAHIRVDGPLAGRILAERVIGNGGECSLQGNLMRVAELEFAFRMNEDICPRTAPYTVAEVMDRVATLHPAIEMPDSRLAAFERAGDAALIADNACAHDFLLGAACPPLWRSLDLATHEVWGYIGDRPPRPGIGGNALGDPRVALAWLANELSHYGTTLRAGEVVTTGTCLVPLPVKPGDRLRGDFGVIGEVSVTFA